MPQPPLLHQEGSCEPAIPFANTPENGGGLWQRPHLNHLRLLKPKVVAGFRWYASFKPREPSPFFWPQFCLIPCCPAVRQAITKMKRHSNTLLFTLGSILVVSSVLFAQQIGDLPTIPVHINESEIENGRVPLDDV